MQLLNRNLLTFLLSMVRGSDHLLGVRIDIQLNVCIFRL